MDYNAYYKKKWKKLYILYIYIDYVFAIDVKLFFRISIANICFFFQTNHRQSQSNNQSPVTIGPVKEPETLVCLKNNEYKRFEYGKNSFIFNVCKCPN